MQSWPNSQATSHPRASTPLSTRASVRSGSWLARPEGSEASPVRVSLAPDTDAQSLLLAPGPPRQVPAEQAALSALTGAPHPAGPTALFPLPCSWLPALGPLAARPSQGQAVLEKCWEVAECAVFEFLQTGAPIPGQTAAVFAVHKGLCSPSRPGDPGQPACGGRAGRQQADVTGPRPTGERHGQTGR